MAYLLDNRINSTIQMIKLLLKFENLELMFRLKYKKLKLYLLKLNFGFMVFICAANSYEIPTFFRIK